MPETTPPEKHAGGRPSKLTAEFISVAHEVIEQGDNALIYTDEELLFAINEKLSNDARIGKRTFEKWKAGEVSEDVEGQEFVRLITRALQKQKREIFSRFKEDEKSWQRWVWIIERKWNEWNLKKNIGISKTEDGASALAAALLDADNDADAPAPGPDEAATGSNPAKDA